MADMIHSLKAVLGTDLLDRILGSKILVVGAGGIGSELLKNLALTGFRTVHVIDLDTIDVSNLNRQLLFRSQHVGQPKCVVACQVAQELAIDPGAVFQAHHGNVCDNSRFNVQFLAQFDVILGALDNVAARQRVNRLALAASKPLVEAGTTGYLGQCNVLHKASDTACYECHTKETGKVYPICTIRSTPSAPVHCIVWAKELYKLLFGEKMEDSMLHETNESKEEPSTYMTAVDELRGGEGQPGNTATAAAASSAAALALLRALYIAEIQKQLDMNRYAGAKVVPTVLDGALLTPESLVPPPTSLPTYRTTDVWSTAECIAELVDCISCPEAKLPVFDKDDDLAMRFVTAASNLRMIVFGITPLQSFYSAKGIAGNIIPAIATTNAIVAGLQILQTFHILKAQMQGRGEQLRDCCHYINCIRLPVRNGLYLTSGMLDKPNPACFVCSKANLPLNLKIAEWTLRDLLEKVVKKNLGFEAPSILIESDTIWEEGDGADTEAFVANLDKKLMELPGGGIQNGTLIVIEDFTQDLEVNVAILNVEKWETEEDESEVHKFVLGGSKPTVKAAKEYDSSKLPPAGAADDDDDVIFVDDSTSAATRKRGRSEGTSSRSPKKSKPSTDDEIVVIDD